MAEPSIFPAINASLNESGAVCTSALFLCSYLYYHLVVMGGVATRFQGQGWVRTLYFAVLLSHTVLAVIIVPMVLVTLARGLRGNFDKHRRIARWTFPVWLYVSVTGVAVYFMLYRL
jgi:uncharacterized membrane protein YozB (DUF420 family)